MAKTEFNLANSAYFDDLTVLPAELMLNDCTSLARKLTEELRLSAELDLLSEKDPGSRGLAVFAALPLSLGLPFLASLATFKGQLPGAVLPPELRFEARKVSRNSPSTSI